DDIPLLAAHFLEEYATRYRKSVTKFHADAMRALLGYGWPGNVRELAHAVERAVLLAEGDTVRTIDLNLHPPGEVAARLEDMSLEDVERVLIQKALARAGGNVSTAAKALGLSRSALYRRLERHGL
ncbi:MAG TPA: helix-turn-helix domain-containing protein, partial [Gemmatimonadales bacterium]|nr:helix-turn-helix domain-containing protein [Gemmatimonadales bacterium]